MLLVKTFHLLFVMGWMACLFVVPRMLLHWRTANEAAEKSQSLPRLTIALFRFGSLMATLALFFGAWLWIGYGFSGHWLNLKIAFVGLLILYHLISGWFIYIAITHSVFKSILFLRIFNESSLLLVIPIIYCVVAKPT